MKTSRDRLSEVLREWRVTPSTDPDFLSSVWRRIDARVNGTWRGYILAHAAVWAFVATMTLGAAAYTGTALARERIHADRQALVSTYLVELDPRVRASLKP